MNKSYLALGASLVAVVIAIGGYFFPNVPVFKEVNETLGAMGTRFPNGLSTNSTSPDVGELQTTTLEVDSTSSLEGDVTLGGGASALTITTTNTATSSLKVGCIDTHATSTQTPIRLSATTTPGIAYWSYGLCSSL